MVDFQNFPGSMPRTPLEGEKNFPLRCASRKFFFTTAQNPVKLLLASAPATAMEWLSEIISDF